MSEDGLVGENPHTSGIRVIRVLRGFCVIVKTSVSVSHCDL